MMCAVEKSLCPSQHLCTCQGFGGSEDVKVPYSCTRIPLSQVCQSNEKKVTSASDEEEDDAGDDGFFEDDWFDDYEDSDNEVESADSAHLPDHVFSNYDQGQT